MVQRPNDQHFDSVAVVAVAQSIALLVVVVAVVSGGEKSFLDGVLADTANDGSAAAFVAAVFVWLFS